MASMVTNASNLNLSAPLRRSASNLQFTWPAGEQFYFEPDQVVKMTWTPAIEEGSWGTLDIFEMGSTGSPLTLNNNVAGSSFSWYVTSNPEDQYFVDGGVYWLRLLVLPDAIGAKSGQMTFRLPSKGTASPSTRASLRTASSADVPKATVRFYDGLSSSGGQSPRASAIAAIVIGSGVLGICLLVLLGLFVYRRRRSSRASSEPVTDHDKVVGNLPEQQGEKGAPETEAVGPKIQIDDVEARGHTAANRGFHEVV